MMSMMSMMKKSMASSFGPDEYAPCRARVNGVVDGSGLGGNMNEKNLSSTDAPHGKKEGTETLTEESPFEDGNGDKEKCVFNDMKDLRGATLHRLHPK